jgi:hypothetical protein
LTIEDTNRKARDVSSSGTVDISRRLARKMARKGEFLGSVQSMQGIEMEVVEESFVAGETIQSLM